MKRRYQNRREFIQNLGQAAVLLPSLQSVLLEKIALGATTSKTPDYVIFVFSSNGVRASAWNYGTPPGDIWEIKTSTPLVKASPISAFQRPFSYHLSGPIWTDALLSKVTLLRGLDSPIYMETDHAETYPLTGYGKSIRGRIDVPHAVSLDQILANNPAFRTGYTKPSVHLQVRKSSQTGATTVSRWAQGGSLTPIQHQSDPMAAYTSLFSGATQSIAQQNKRRVQGQTVAQALQKAYSELVGNPKLSVGDRQRLDSQVTFMSDLERQLLSMPGGASCLVPNGSFSIGNSEADIPQNMQKQMEILVGALRCGLTRVATFMLCPETDLNSGSFLSPPPGADHHSLSHDAQGNTASRDKKNQIDQWYYEQYGKLIQMLDSIVVDSATGQTLLDRGLVVMVNSAGTIVNGAEVHDGTDIPVLVSGGSDFFKRGYVIDYRHATITRDNMCCGGARHTYGYKLGIPYNRLLTTLAQMMGLTPADYEQPGYYALGRLDNNDYNQYDMSRSGLNTPLPVFPKNIL